MTVIKYEPPKQPEAAESPKKEKDTLKECAYCEGTLDQIQSTLSFLLPEHGEPMLPDLMLCADMSRSLGYVGAVTGAFAGIPLANIHYGVRVSRRRYIWGSIVSSIGFGIAFYGYNVVFHKACHPTNRRINGSGWIRPEQKQKQEQNQ